MGSLASLERIAGHPGLDFVNTLGGLPEDPDDEYLHDYADLVALAAGAGLVARASADRLGRAARRRPADARRVLDDGLRLRGAVDRILRARLEGRPPSAGDATAVREAYAAALRTATLQPTADHYDWSWPDRAPSLELPLHLLAAQVVDLLRTADLGRLSRCGHCRWLFLDTSRNRSRRWCSMSACGSVVKMRRYRAVRRVDDRSRTTR